MLACFGMIWSCDNVLRQNTKFGEICTLLKIIFIQIWFLKHVTYLGPMFYFWQNFTKWLYPNGPFYTLPPTPIPHPPLYNVFLIHYLHNYLKLINHW